MENFKLSSIEDAIKDFREGKFVIVVDDEDRENEGDLIIAAEKITAEKVNFMLKHARGGNKIKIFCQIGGYKNDKQDSYSEVTK